MQNAQIPFICQLDWSMGCPYSRLKYYFLDVSIRVFLEEISMWMSRLNKDHPLQCGWVPPNPFRAGIEQKGLRRGEFALWSSWDTHLPLPSDISPPDFQVSAGLYPVFFVSSLQMSECEMPQLHNWVSQLL